MSDQRDELIERLSAENRKLSDNNATLTRSNKLLTDDVARLASACQRLEREQHATDTRASEYMVEGTRHLKALNDLHDAADLTRLETRAYEWLAEQRSVYAKRLVAYFDRLDEALRKVGRYG